MTKQQRQLAIVGGGALVLFLLYMYYRGRQNTAATGTSTPATNTAGTDYAALAGQEQGDMAAMQSQNQQLLAQEQSDVASLQGSIAGVTATDQGNVAALGGLIGNLAATVQGLQPPNLAPFESEIAAIASGQKQISRTLAQQNATTATKKGSAFYKYYQQVTGHAPPAHIAVSDFIYQAWKQGVKASAFTSKAKAKSQPHPSAPKNTNVAHPNPNHTQQSNAHKPSAPARPPPKKPAPKVKQKPPARRK